MLQENCFLHQVRWQIAVLSHIGLAISFGIRSNFGVSKSRMITNFTDAFNVTHSQKFFWTPTEVGWIESSFFYGYAVSQIPAGLLAAKFAPDRILCLGILLASVINIFTGIAFYFHPYSDILVICLQILQGIGLGVTYPAMHGIWRYWAPPLERSKLATMTFTGASVGIMIGQSVSAVLISYVNWSAPFFLFGVLGITWSFIWYTVAAHTPEDHCYISVKEKCYIRESVGEVAGKKIDLSSIPWKSIITSLPVWAICLANFCRCWTLFLFLGNQIQYLTNVLHIEIRASGLLSTLPQALSAISIFSSGQLADYLLSTGKMSTGGVRKLMNTIGFSWEAGCFCILAFTHNPVIGVTVLMLDSLICGFSMAGFNVNHFDIAPRYASILMGLSNGIGALAGLSGYLTQNLTMNNPGGWKYCLLIAMCVDLIGMIFYQVFSKGVVQDWAKENKPEEKIESQKESSNPVSTQSLRNDSVSSQEEKKPNNENF